MKMKQGILVFTMIVATSSAGTSYGFGFGVPSLPGVGAVTGAGGGGLSGGSVDQFIAASKASNTLINKSRVNLALALSTQEERAKIKDQQAQIQKGLDSNDKTAVEQNREFMTSLDATIKQKANDDQATQQLKSLTADQSQAVAKSLANLGLGLLMQKDQITAGKSMITGISSNPTLISKLPDVKDAVSTMGDNISGTAGYIGTLPKLFQSAGIKVAMPTDTTSTPVEVSDAGF